MTTLSDLEKYIESGNWKKTVKKADEILSATPFEAGENRFSFMHKDTFCLYSMRHPGTEPVWIKNHSNVAYCKGYALNELKRYDEAEQILRFCLTLDPVSVKIRTELFSSLVRQSKNAEAGQVLNEAENDILSPDNACRIYAKKAYLLSCEERFEEAAEACVYSLLFGFSAGAVNELGYIEQKTGKAPEYMPGDENFISYATAVGQSLVEKGIIRPFPTENLRVLKMLKGLYNIGQDEELMTEYTDRLEKFRICGFEE